MAIRKRPTRSGAAAMKTTGCPVGALPPSQIRWQVDYKDSAGVRRHKQFKRLTDAKAWETTTRHSVQQGTHRPESTLPTSARPPQLGFGAARAKAWSARPLNNAGST